MFEIANEHGFIDKLLSISKKLIKWWYENHVDTHSYKFCLVFNSVFTHTLIWKFGHCEDDQFQLQQC